MLVAATLKLCSAVNQSFYLCRIVFSFHSFHCAQSSIKFFSIALSLLHSFLCLCQGLKVPDFQTWASGLHQTLKLQCSGCREATRDPEDLQLQGQCWIPWDQPASPCRELPQRLSHSAGWRCPAVGNSLSTRAGHGRRRGMLADRSN